MLPYSLGAAVASALSGILVSRTGQYRPTMWVAYGVFTVGLGLMYMLSGTSSRCVNELSMDSLLNMIQGGEGCVSPYNCAGPRLPFPGKP